MTDLVTKLNDRKARVGVIGLGYVGLPPAVAFGESGHDVLGFEVDDSKVAAIGRGESYIPDIEATAVAALVKAGRFNATTDFSRLAECDTISVCVPTPFGKPVILTLRISSRPRTRSLRPASRTTRGTGEYDIPRNNDGDCGTQTVRDGPECRD